MAVDPEDINLETTATPEDFEIFIPANQPAIPDEHNTNPNAYVNFEIAPGIPVRASSLLVLQESSPTHLPGGYSDEEYITRDPKNNKSLWEAAPGWIKADVAITNAWINAVETMNPLQNWKDRTEEIRQEAYANTEEDSWGSAWKRNVVIPARENPIIEQGLGLLTAFTPYGTGLAKEEWRQRAFERGNDSTMEMVAEAAVWTSLSALNAFETGAVLGTIGMAAKSPYYAQQYLSAIGRDEDSLPRTMMNLVAPITVSAEGLLGLATLFPQDPGAVIGNLAPSLFYMKPATNIASKVTTSDIAQAAVKRAGIEDIKVVRDPLDPAGQWRFTAREDTANLLPTHDLDVKDISAASKRVVDHKEWVRTLSPDKAAWRADFFQRFDEAINERIDLFQEAQNRGLTQRDALEYVESKATTKWNELYAEARSLSPIGRDIKTESIIDYVDLEHTWSRGQDIYKQYGIVENPYVPEPPWYPRSLLAQRTTDAIRNVRSFLKEAETVPLDNINRDYINTVGGKEVVMVQITDTATNTIQGYRLYYYDQVIRATRTEPGQSVTLYAVEETLTGRGGKTRNELVKLSQEEMDGFVQAYERDTGGADVLWRLDNNQDVVVAPAKPQAPAAISFEGLSTTIKRIVSTVEDAYYRSYSPYAVTTLSERIANRVRTHMTGMSRAKDTLKTGTMPFLRGLPPRLHAALKGLPSQIIESIHALPKQAWYGIRDVTRSILNVVQQRTLRARSETMLMPEFSLDGSFVGVFPRTAGPAIAMSSLSNIARMLGLDKSRLMINGEAFIPYQIMDLRKSPNTFFGRRAGATYERAWQDVLDTWGRNTKLADHSIAKGAAKLLPSSYYLASTLDLLTRVPKTSYVGWPAYLLKADVVWRTGNPLLVMGGLTPARLIVGATAGTAAQSQLFYDYGHTARSILDPITAFLNTGGTVLQNAVTNPINTQMQTPAQQEATKTLEQHMTEESRYWSSTRIPLKDANGNLYYLSIDQKFKNLDEEGEEITLNSIPILIDLRFRRERGLTTLKPTIPRAEKITWNMANLKKYSATQIIIDKSFVNERGLAGKVIRMGGLVKGKKVKGKVVKVVDGDTFDVYMDYGRVERVRVMGIDTPESTAYYKNDPAKFSDSTNKDPSQRYTITDRKHMYMTALNAKHYAEQMILDREVYVELSSSGTDMYGRNLAYIYFAQPGGSVTDYGEEVLKRGYARVSQYAFDAEKTKKYKSLSETARKRRLGVWLNASSPESAMITTMSDEEKQQIINKATAITVTKVEQGLAMHVAAASNGSLTL